MRERVPAVEPAPREVAERYFACMRESDLAVIDLFHDDAELRGLGMRRVGRDEISEFYTGIVNDARPSPSPVGRLLADENRVFAQIDISLPDGTLVHAIDVFCVEQGRIRSLTYYTADIRGE